MFFFVNNLVQDFETIFGDASLQCGVVSRSQLRSRSAAEGWDSKHQSIPSKTNSPLWR
jgi:hypothetical protein